MALAVGGDQRLYRWYFSNGSWSGWQQVSTGFLVNQILFGPLAASSWGEGSVDLALIEAQTGALYHGRLGPSHFSAGLTFGLTPSRAFTIVGGNVIDTAVLTAFSPSRLHLLAVGTDHIVYSNWARPDPSVQLVRANQAPPIVWTGYGHIGGHRVLLGGVRGNSRQEMTAVGTNRSGRVMISRYNAGGWNQFASVIGQSNKHAIESASLSSGIGPLVAQLRKAFPILE